MQAVIRLSPKILILGLFGIIMLCCSYLMFVYDPLQLLIKKILTITPGGIYFNLWSQPPYKVYFNLYIFNVTNPQAFLEKKDVLRVNEIGPYSYQEILTNENITFNENGTITYYPKRKLIFLPENSVGNPATDWVITPNIPLVGIQSSLRDASFFTNMGLSSIASMIEAPSFKNLTIDEYLWGYDDKLVTLANDYIPSWINFQRFGLLDRIMALDNATNVLSMTIDTTAGKPKNPLYTEEEINNNFYVQEFNGSPGLHHWGYKDSKEGETSASNSRCNFIGGSYDGTIFPQNLNANNTRFKLYRRAFCRHFSVKLDKEVITKDGYVGMKYTVDKNFLETPDKNPENKCYEDENHPLPKGLTNVAPCYYGIPITLSQPHFFNSDPKLLEQVQGLKPNESKHDMDLILHKDLGVPLAANLRIQINLDVGETKYNPITEPFNKLHIPLCWIEVRFDEVPTIVAVASVLFYDILPIIQELCKFIFALLGVTLIGCSTMWLVYFRNNPDTKNSFFLSRFRLSKNKTYKTISDVPVSVDCQNHKMELC